jgi:hypothetical protein
MASFDIYQIAQSEFHTVESDCDSLNEFVEQIHQKKFLIARFTTWAGRKLPQPMEFALDVGSILRIAKGRGN